MFSWKLLHSTDGFSDVRISVMQKTLLEKIYYSQGYRTWEFFFFF